jgi:hypothetical protein
MKILKELPWEILPGQFFQYGNIATNSLHRQPAQPETGD